MTNYWQLFWRMASLHPVFPFILFSQLAPTQAPRSRLHWHRNALSQMCLEMKLLSGLSFCSNACAPKGLSYRILEQIPAQGHTFYLCGLFNSTAEGGWMQGSAVTEQRLRSQTEPPKFLKSRYVITRWPCSVCVCVVGDESLTSGEWWKLTSTRVTSFYPLLPFLLYSSHSTLTPLLLSAATSLNFGSSYKIRHMQGAAPRQPV